MRNSKSFDDSQGASNTNAHLGYLPQLDGLRVLAVGMVMMGHWWQWKWTQPILKGLPLVHGVTLFFVLSGYLITRILLQENHIRIHNGQGYLPFMVRFYVRRTLRIFPLYYMVIFSLFLIDYPNARELFPWLLSYTTNIYQSIHNTYVGDFNHFWSLGVEEQFYLFWPWLLLAFPRSKSLIWAMLGIAVLGMGTRIYLAVEVGKWMATSYFTLSCMPILAMGGIAPHLPFGLAAVPGCLCFSSCTWRVCFCKSSFNGDGTKNWWMSIFLLCCLCC
jgi:peptidoglycan/LPS O-acetylase OafA/YrhL